MTGWDDFEQEVPIEQVAYDATPVMVNPETERREHMRRLDAIENELLESSVSIMNHANGFADLEEVGGEIVLPKEWRDRYGEKEALRRFRVAKLALLPAKEAPVGLRMAQTTALGILKVRENRTAQPHVNIQVVQMPGPKNYALPEKFVDE